MALWVRQFGNVRFRYTLEENPQNTCVMHTHEDLEIYYFLSGDCTYLIEGTAHKLIVNDEHIPYERIGITLPLEEFESVDREHHLFDAMLQRPLGTNNRFTIDDFGNTLCETVMAQIAERGQTMSHAEVLSHIFLLLTEADRVLKYKSGNALNEHRATTVGTRLIDYTNEHLYTGISMQQLCDTFFLSYSQINRIFKQHTGTTAGQYITTKRLLTARDRIRHGTSPAEACYTCGYNDYSSFYRAYVKYFGHSPQDDKKTAVE